MTQRLCTLTAAVAVAMSLTIPAPANAAAAAPRAAAPADATTPDPTVPDPTVPDPTTPTPAPTPAPPPSTEHMRHWTCDRKGVADVTVTWLSVHQATVSWTLTDTVSDGKSPLIKMVAVSFNGGLKDTRANFFSGDGDRAATGGRGAQISGTRTWTPHIARFDKLEVWIYNGLGRERAICGYNIIKRLNDFVYSPKRTDPTPYAQSSSIRKAIVAEADKQLHSNFHEGYQNCNKFTNYFLQQRVCQPWCAVFAWYVWTAAGVPFAKRYESSFTDDFQDEWRINFKPLGGPRKPEVGDVVIWSHQTDGINGHVGVVVAVKGWNIRMIHGNWTDTVLLSPWTDPFTRTADHGHKHVIGFASPV